MNFKDNLTKAQSSKEAVKQNWLNENGKEEFKKLIASLEQGYENADATEKADFDALKNEIQNIIKEWEKSKTETQTEISDLASEVVTENSDQYTVDKLQTMKDKSWPDLLSDSNYIYTIQKIIIATGAKHNSITAEKLADRIYGKGTKAGVKTLQTYLNTTYTTSLKIDGLAGPATLKALLEKDGEITRLEKIMNDKISGIEPIAPESTTGVGDKDEKGGNTLNNPQGVSKKEKTVDGTIPEEEQEPQSTPGIGVLKDTKDIPVNQNKYNELLATQFLNPIQKTAIVNFITKKGGIKNFIDYNDQVTGLSFLIGGEKGTRKRGDGPMKAESIKSEKPFIQIGTFKDGKFRHGLIIDDKGNVKYDFSEPVNNETLATDYMPKRIEDISKEINNNKTVTLSPEEQAQRNFESKKTKYRNSHNISSRGYDRTISFLNDEGEIAKDLSNLDLIEIRGSNYQTKEEGENVTTISLKRKDNESIESFAKRAIRLSTLINRSFYIVKNNDQTLDKFDTRRTNIVQANYKGYKLKGGLISSEMINLNSSNSYGFTGKTVAEYMNAEWKLLPEAMKTKNNNASEEVKETEEVKEKE